MDKFVTAFERHQQEKGEGLHQLAARLGLSSATVWKLTGRMYQPRQDGEFGIAHRILRIVAEDTGIPTDTLFDDAQAAYQSRLASTTDA